MPVQDSSQAGEIEQPLDGAADVPAQTTDEVSAETEQQPEQKFTRAEVEAMLADFEKKVESRIQSQVAKSENRTDARIQERLAALDINRAALNLSDEQYEAAQDAIIREEQKNAYKPQSPKGNETQQTAPDLGETERFVTSQIDAVFQEVGVRVTPDDAEFKLIQQAWNDPKGNLAKTLIAVNQAATQKANRLKALKGNAPARAGMGGGSNSDSSNISSINDSATLYEIGDKQIRERRR